MASGRIGSSLRTPAAALVLVALVAVATSYDSRPGRSLWLDESHTAELYAQLPSGVDVMSTVAGRINQAPLFFLFTWLLGHIGEDEVILRLPSAVFGTLCVVAVFVLARRLFGVRVALFAALLLTFLPFAVWLSQEARPYALLMLMTTLQMYYAYRATTEGRWPFWIGLAAATALNLYTHYFAFVVTGAMALYVGAFILRDALRSAHARAIVAGGVAIAIVAGVTALRGRNLVKTGAHELEHLAANPFWSSLAGWALVAVAVVAVGGVYWFCRRPRPRVMERAAGGALVLVAIALAALALVLPHRDGYLPSVLATAIVFAGAAVVAAGAGLLVRVLSPVEGAAARLEGAMGAGVLAAASYAPWLSALHLFIFRSDQGIGRLPPNHLSVTDALTLLARLDL